MAVVKKNTAKPNTNNLTVLQPKVNREEATQRPVIKQKPAAVQSDVKLEPTKMPAAVESIPEATVDESNGTIIIAVALLSAVWYMACILVII